ncbi:MAG: PilZ domain-containing protein [Pseudomonadota bacterium]
MQTDQRQSQRKVFKTRAMLAVEGGAPVLGRTTDIGANGVSLTVPHPVGVGQAAQLRFDLLVDGNVIPVNTRAKAQYCILSGGDFKVGFQFLNLELAAMTALSRFLR